MKKIFTLMLGLGCLTAVFAQSGHREGYNNGFSHFNNGYQHRSFNDNGYSNREGNNNFSNERTYNYDNENFTRNRYERQRRFTYMNRFQERGFGRRIEKRREW